MAQVNPYETPKAALADGGGGTQPVRLFAISGRIARVRYIAYGMLVYLVGAAIAVLAGAALGDAGVVVAGAAWVAMLVLGFMLTVQRSHDFNMSGWLSLLVIVPLVNLLFWFVPGTDGPNRYGPPTPPNGLGVILGACVAPLTVVAGILAAVAIPAYQGYGDRARVSEVILSGSSWRTAVNEHYARTGRLPNTVADLSREAVPAAADGRHPASASLGADGVITLSISRHMGRQLAEKTVVLRPRIESDALHWDCTGGTLEPRFRPASCR
jgi:uncharacterized membrane protein YhaH (DUF805 family)